MSSRLATTPSSASRARRRLVDRRHDPLQALAVELHDRRDQLVGDRAGLEVLDLLELRRELLDPRDQFVGGQHIPVGVWTTLRTLPFPYMCTPQGRHGSKLWTARMMSIPLKFSGPFSSKIGVFCTASSYGPGVP